MRHPWETPEEALARGKKEFDEAIHTIVCCLARQIVREQIEQAEAHERELQANPSTKG